MRCVQARVATGLHTFVGRKRIGAAVGVGRLNHLARRRRAGARQDALDVLDGFVLQAVGHTGGLCSMACVFCCARNSGGMLF
jgi:hypothetical protein